MKRCIEVKPNEYDQEDQKVTKAGNACPPSRKHSQLGSAISHLPNSSTFGKIYSLMAVIDYNSVDTQIKGKISDYVISHVQSVVYLIWRFSRALGVTRSQVVGRLLWSQIPLPKQGLAGK